MSDYQPKPYPRMLYKGDVFTIVPDEAGEEAARADGYADYSERFAPPSEPDAPKALEDMKPGELISYAKAEGLDIGDLKPQAGKEKILAAVLAAQKAGE